MTLTQASPDTAAAGEPPVEPLSSALRALLISLAREPQICRGQHVIHAGLLVDRGLATDAGESHFEISPSGRRFIAMSKLGRERRLVQQSEVSA
jgi:hypothetical protein